MNTHNADLKLPLIDLEADNTATGGKQEQSSVQPERLSEGDNMYCIYWIHLPEHKDIYSEGYVGFTINLKQRIKSHKKNKYKTHFTNAFNKYKWENLIIDVIEYKQFLSEILQLEKKYRPTQNIGWNSQQGGILGLEKNWYLITENKLKHSKNTSINTIKGINKNDSKEKRSERAKLSRLNNKESYKKVSVGSNNGKALLNEEQVKCIKCELLKQNIKDKIIAEMYNVKNYVIAFIRKGKTWKHVVCDSPDHE